MGVPFENVDMTSHMQYVTVRNARGRAMLGSVSDRLKTTPAVSSGDRKPFVLETVLSDDRATLGEKRRAPVAAADVLTPGPGVIAFSTTNLLVFNNRCTDRSPYHRRREPAPLFVGKILAWVLEKLGPKVRGGSLDNTIGLGYGVTMGNPTHFQPGSSFSSRLFP